jgi:hypothetical protein|tara:strand:- start:92 stop:418 length:327 start_codon:yes stop_codon:yes gene_type:complete
MDDLALRRFTSVNLPAALSLSGAEIFKLTAHICNRGIQLFDASFKVAVGVGFWTIPGAEGLTTVLHARCVEHRALVAKSTTAVSLGEQPPTEACRSQNGTTHKGGQSS